jgi:hypothetical protein
LKAPTGDTKYSAVIDTGSSNTGIPDAMFKDLKHQWGEDLGDIDCITDDNFC